MPEWEREREKITKKPEIGIVPEHNITVFIKLGSDSGRQQRQFTALS